jgi:hypothetical protein
LALVIGVGHGMTMVLVLSELSTQKYHKSIQLKNKTHLFIDERDFTAVQTALFYAKF